MRDVRATIVEEHKYYLFWVCVCSLWYSGRIEQAPYCHLWSASLHNIFPLCLTNRTIFEKKKKRKEKEKIYWTQNVCFDCRHNNSKKNWARYGRTRILVCMWSAPDSCTILRKPEYSQTNFRKILERSTFTKIRPLGEELFHADRRMHTTKPKSRFWKFC